ncbi:MAG: hypothetical protein M1838_001123, partial [Thelocarpon superellum]
VCSKRIRNPTYTAPGPLPTDYTWGCAPGFLCKPPKEDGCEIEAGLPDPGYYCSPDECEPVVPLNPPQSWGAPVTSNATAKYVLQDDYFNIGPQNFSLGYDIFVTQSSVVVDQQGGAATTDVPGAKTKRSYAELTVRVARVARAIMAGDQSRLSKRAETAPPACYDDCNAPALEAESSGKTPALCDPQNAFTADVDGCKACIADHAGGKSTSFADSVQPDLQQFLDFCSGSDLAATVSSASPAQSEVSGGASTSGASAVAAAPALNTSPTSSHPPSSKSPPHTTPGPSSGSPSSSPLSPGGSSVASSGASGPTSSTSSASDGGTASAAAPPASFTGAAPSQLHAISYLLLTTAIASVWFLNA